MLLNSVLLVAPYLMQGGPTVGVSWIYVTSPPGSTKETASVPDSLPHRTPSTLVADSVPVYQRPGSSSALLPVAHDMDGGIDIPWWRKGDYLRMEPLPSPGGATCGWRYYSDDGDVGDRACSGGKAVLASGILALAVPPGLRGCAGDTHLPFRLCWNIPRSS